MELLSILDLLDKFVGTSLSQTQISKHELFW